MNKKKFRIIYSKYKIIKFKQYLKILFFLIIFKNKIFQFFINFIFSILNFQWKDSISLGYEKKKLLKFEKNKKYSILINIFYLTNFC
jgi:hypothetical protein